MDDELIRELLSLMCSLPERRPEEDEDEEGFLACETVGLEILKEDEPELEEDFISDIVLCLDVSTVTRVDGFEILPGSRILVVVDGFWSSREKTEDTDTFSL